MTTCEKMAENSRPHVGHVCSTETPVVLSSPCNRNAFKLAVTIWVYGKKVQVEALVDSGVTTSFINQSVVESNNLVTHKLANPYNVYNTGGASNKSRQIRYGV